MYKGFFRLKENPFNVNPDPWYMLLTKQIEEALSGLTYGIQTKKGILTLTGEVGTGKTTLVNRLLDWLNTQRTRTAFLFNSRMNSTQLFDFVLSEFEIACDSSPEAIGSASLAAGSWKKNHTRSRIQTAQSRRAGWNSFVN